MHKRFTTGLTRRQAMGAIAVTAAGGIFLPPAAMASEPSPYAGLQLFGEGAGACLLTPEVTEGPFYFDSKLQRADIGEGRAGVPLTVRMQVVDTACRPIAGARVDIWHCDAQGHYSGYPGQGDRRDVDTTGQTFLRGWQDTDANGLVAFSTVYPGWYRGRTTHIHFKVHPDDRSVMTGQMFFPDALSDQIFTANAAYERPERRDTMNADDGIARQAGRASHAALREQPKTYEALMIVAIRPPS